MQHSQIIAFIGGGNMAQALIGGLLRDGHEPDRLRVADPQDAQREKLRQQGVVVFADNAGAADGADVIVLAVKPQVMDAALAGLAGAVGGKALIVSIAAGITLEKLGAGLGHERPLVRAMPNTPALFGRGITGMTANAAVEAADRRLAEAVLGAAGEVVWVESEAQIDAVTAVSGSGPAYFFLLTEALADAAEKQGLPPEIAHALAAHTARGAGTMLAQSDADTAELRRRVTSPGGTTEAALKVLDAAGLRETMQQAVDAAVQRARELGM